MKLILALISLFFSWPSFTLPVSGYLNKGNRLQVLQLGKTTPVITAIEQLAEILQNLHVRTVIVVDIEKEEFEYALKDSDIGNRVKTLV